MTATIIAIWRFNSNFENLLTFKYRENEQISLVFRFNLIPLNFTSLGKVQETCTIFLVPLFRNFQNNM